MATPLHFVSNKVYPRLTSGRFNNWRIAFILLTQLIYFGLPWLSWDGHQAVRFDFSSMRLYLFDLILLPQDFIYLAAALIVAALGLFLWTMLAGRLWCGFSCPQTVYTQIMLWIERWVEGAPNERRRRDAAPWSVDKVVRKSTTQMLMGLFSLWTGLTLVGYFSPIRELAFSLGQFSIGYWEAAFALSYASFTWLLAGVLREQVCKHMCPYARFQGVMFDRNTLLIAYDEQRGEPRGARRKVIPIAAASAADMAMASRVAANVSQAEKPQGSCVDCGLCVQVCPAGIDIRKGLQYECIGCGLCIDACDEVMDRTGQARGLIRFGTQNAMAARRPVTSVLRRPRALIYGGLLLGIVALSATGLALRLPFKADILRDRAVMVRESNDGYIENAYTLRIMNTEREVRQYKLEVEEADKIVRIESPVLTVGADSLASFNIALLADPATLDSGSHTVHLRLINVAVPTQVLREETRVLMP